MMTDSFVTHCFIEFYYRTQKGFLNEHNSRIPLRQLNEKYGVFNGCEELSKMIANNILNSKNKKTLSIYVNCKWISKITIFLYYNKETNIGASYIANSSKITRQNNVKGDVYKFFPLELEVNLSKVENRQDLIIRLMHELTHAYEDYNRQIKEKESLVHLAIKGGDNLNAVGTYDGLKQLISYLLYYIREYERNAFMAQLKGELVISSKRFNNIREIIKFLCNTTVYKNYKKIINYISEIDKVTNKNVQQEILRYVGELSHYNFDSYRDFCKFLNQKKYAIVKKVNNLMPKIAYENLTFGNYLNNFNEPIENNLERFLEK